MNAAVGDAGAFGEDQDRSALVENLVARAERVVVAAHQRRVVLLAIDRECAAQPQREAADPRLEGRRHRQEMQAARDRGGEQQHVGERRGMIRDHQ
jgi:hypothetical protein